MAVKVAINGFEYYWTSCFPNRCLGEGFEIVAINDLTSPTMLALTEI